VDEQNAQTPKGRRHRRGFEQQAYDSEVGCSASHSQNPGMSTMEVVIIPPFLF
jgi:hypothetical protein